LAESSRCAAQLIFAFIELNRYTSIWLRVQDFVSGERRLVLAHAASWIVPSFPLDPRMVAEMIQMLTVENLYPARSELKAIGREETTHFYCLRIQATTRQIYVYYISAIVRYFVKSVTAAHRFRPIHSGCP